MSADQTLSPAFIRNLLKRKSGVSTLCQDYTSLRADWDTVYSLDIDHHPSTGHQHDSRLLALYFTFDIRSVLGKAALLSPSTSINTYISGSRDARPDSGRRGRRGKDYARDIIDWSAYHTETSDLTLGFGRCWSRSSTRSCIHPCRESRPVCLTSYDTPAQTELRGRANQVQTTIAISFINHIGFRSLPESTQCENNGRTQHSQDTDTVRTHIPDPGFTDIPLERDVGQVSWLVDRLAMDRCP